jgi:hypothetical protein
MAANQKLVLLTGFGYQRLQDLIDQAMEAHDDYELIDHKFFCDPSHQKEAQGKAVPFYAVTLVFAN